MTKAQWRVSVIGGLAAGLLACTNPTSSPGNNLASLVMPDLGRLNSSERYCITGSGREVHFKARSGLLLALAKRDADSLGGWESIGQGDYVGEIVAYRYGFSAPFGRVQSTTEAPAGSPVTCAWLTE